MEVIQKISLDLQCPAARQVIFAKQEDSLTRVVELTLFDGGKPWPVAQIVQACHKLVVYGKPDKTGGTYDALPDGKTPAVSIYEGVDNVLLVTLCPQVFTCPGTVKCELQLSTDDGKRISTFSWYIEVEKSADCDVKSKDYYKFTSLNALRAALGELEDLRTKDKSSLVAAINELLDMIGDTSNLTTKDQEIVAAINELVYKIKLLGDRQTAAMLSACADALVNIDEGDVCGIPYFDNLSTAESGQLGILNIQRTEDEENNPGFVEVPSMGKVKGMLDDLDRSDAGAKIYIQAEEPLEAEDGALWIDEDEDPDEDENPGGGGFGPETDPTVPEWAKQPKKPTYTAKEVGAQPAGDYATKKYVDDAVAGIEGGGNSTGERIAATIEEAVDVYFIPLELANYRRCTISVYQPADVVTLQVRFVIDGLTNSVIKEGGTSSNTYFQFEVVEVGEGGINAGGKYCLLGNSRRNNNPGSNVLLHAPISYIASASDENGIYIIGESLPAGTQIIVRCY